MFHVELRQFPHSTSLFNLTREELDARILGPWVGREEIECNDRRWLPGKARLAVYEAPELAPEDRGLGRGWANVTRTGTDVTEQVLAQARAAAAGPAAGDQLEAFQRELLERAPLDVAQLVSLANQRCSGWRVSDRIALIERAVWELLHRGSLQLVIDGDPVVSERWEGVLLDWETWSGAEDPKVVFRSTV